MNANQTARSGTTGDDSSGLQRLQKVLAGAGVGSRRHCEELIEQGRVTVDGKVVNRQGVRVDPQAAVVRVDDERVVVAANRVYLMLNKPAGMVSTMSDERGRLSLADLPAMRRAGHRRLFHVGRLDAETEGLLLLTNDGELAHRLMHPSFRVSKTYLAEVAATIPLQTRRQLRAGVLLDDGPAAADSIRMIDAVPGRALVEIRIHEGRNHLVRRLLAAVGHPVRRLVRTSQGPLRLGDLRSGQTRSLTPQEVSSLYRLIDINEVNARH